MKYNVSINGLEEANRAANFNLQVEADNVVDAVTKAAPLLEQTLHASGLLLAPIAAKVDPATN